jgi:CTP synthase
VVSGTSPDERLVEIIELRDHPYFVASQFHPEFKSRPQRPAPLFREFVAAALEYKHEREESRGEIAAAEGGESRVEAVALEGEIRAAQAGQAGRFAGE